MVLVADLSVLLKETHSQVAVAWRCVKVKTARMKSESHFILCDAFEPPSIIVVELTPVRFMSVFSCRFSVMIFARMSSGFWSRKIWGGGALSMSKSQSCSLTILKPPTWRMLFNKTPEKTAQPTRPSISMAGTSLRTPKEASWIPSSVATRRSAVWFRWLELVDGWKSNWFEEGDTVDGRNPAPPFNV